MKAHAPHRYAVALVASYLAAVTFGGCKKTPVDKSPVGVVKRFILSAQLQRTDEIYALLGPRTRARLAAAAKRATALAGGQRKYAPKEMLSVAWGVGRTADWRPAKFKVTAKDSRRARVQVSGKKAGQVQTLDLVRVDGEWRIELPLAKAPPR